MHGRAIADVLGQHAGKHEVVTLGKAREVEGADVRLDLPHVIRCGPQLLIGDVEDGVVESHRAGFFMGKQRGASPADLTDRRESVVGDQPPAVFLVMGHAVGEIEFVEAHDPGLHVVCPLPSLSIPATNRAA